MCSRVWFVTDRRISQEYPQLQILRALKERCADEDVDFRSLLMDQIVLTISDGQLGKYRSVPSLSFLFKTVSGLVSVVSKLQNQIRFRAFQRLARGRWSLFGGLPATEEAASVTVTA